MNSFDSTVVMAAKVSPAITLATVSASEDAQSWLDQFAMLPWGAISGFLASVYTLCMLADWVYKKILLWKSQH